jgi:hypothetical protein
MQCFRQPPQRKAHQNWRPTPTPDAPRQSNRATRGDGAGSARRRAEGDKKIALAGGAGRGGAHRRRRSARPEPGRPRRAPGKREGSLSRVQSPTQCVAEGAAGARTSPGRRRGPQEVRIKRSVPGPAPTGRCARARARAWPQGAPRGRRARARAPPPAGGRNEGDFRFARHKQDWSSPGMDWGKVGLFLRQWSGSAARRPAAVRWLQRPPAGGAPPRRGGGGGVRAAGSGGAGRRGGAARPPMSGGKRWVGRGAVGPALGGAARRRTAAVGKGAAVAPLALGAARRARQGASWAQLGAAAGAAATMGGPPHGQRTDQRWARGRRGGGARAPARAARPAWAAAARRGGGGACRRQRRRRRRGAHGARAHAPGARALSHCASPAQALPPPASSSGAAGGACSSIVRRSSRSFSGCMFAENAATRAPER